jgi:hypothetical protein
MYMYRLVRYKKKSFKKLLTLLRILEGVFVKTHSLAKASTSLVGSALSSLERALRPCGYIAIEYSIAIFPHDISTHIINSTVRQPDTSCDDSVSWPSWERGARARDHEKSP